MIKKTISRSDELGKVIALALGVDQDMTRRIVLDLEAGQPIKAYIEMHGIDQLLNVDYIVLREAIEVRA